MTAYDGDTEAEGSLHPDARKRYFLGTYPRTTRAVPDELARRSAAKLDELARAPEVLLHLWIRGFGVRLDES